jgi:hypothetical protein
MVDAETAGMLLTQPQRFAKLQEVTKREWALESDEVIEQVRAMKEEQRDLSPEPSKDPSPEQYQRAIDNLSYVANAFLDHLQKTTGWTGFMVLGGPKPDIGGDIAIGSYVLSTMI